ncbi:MAG: RNA polymerase sigma factor [Gemmataceae bacterium]
MPSDADRLLVEQIRRGEARAWETLITRYEGRLLAFVQRRLTDRATSEDVVQETFIGFLNSLVNFDDRRELQTYLFTIASHKITDQLRRQGRHPLQLVADEVLHLERDSQPAASSVARGEEKRELESRAVADALGALLDRWREDGDWERVKVLELLLIKGWANKDVAAFLKISEQQVANIRFAAVKRIAEQVRGAGLPGDVFPELRGD